MAKKFFYNRVYNTKRTIINLVIIGVCIIGVIICFIITSNSQVENHNTPESILNIKKETTIEVNEKYNNDIFFSKIENVDLNDIKVSYPDNFDISTPGAYEIKLEISGKNYKTNLIIVDTIKPILIVKEFKITKGDTYLANDFVESCEDNSNKNCIINFAKGVTEEGIETDYSNYKEPGTYSVIISATDESGNEIVEETKLIIENKNDKATEQKPEEKPQNTTCKYGNGEYDKNTYTIAIDITTNNCAVSLDLYKDSTMTNEINKLMDSETTRIKKDVGALNLDGTLALNRKITAVVNSSGDGIIGYELRMTVTVTKNKKSETVADYKIDNKGKRVFIENKYELSN